MQIEETLFSQIIQGKVPCEKIYEDEHSFAFLTIEPNTKGHTLVVPKKYSRNVLDISDESLSNLILAVKKVSLLLKDKLGAEGVNIHQNNEPAAGQAVFHTHFHVIPRYSGDGLTHWKTESPSREELRAVAETIRS